MFSFIALSYDENEIYCLQTVLLDNGRGISLTSDPHIARWKKGDNLFAIITEHALSFPLNDFIFAYGIPLSADLIPEREEIYSGERMDISVEQILHGSLIPPPWQRLFVTLKYGKLLNGVPHPINEKMWRYEVGEFDSSVLKYQAPDECEDIQEVVTIYNSCEINTIDNEYAFFGAEKTTIIDL